MAADGASIVCVQVTNRNQRPTRPPRPPGSTPGASARQLAADLQPDGAACLTVDLDAIRRNYQRISSAVARAETAAVLKADAYGLGACEVARALVDAGCRSLFVANLGEALSLKALRLGEVSIFVLNGLLPGTEALCRSAGVLPVLNSYEQAMRWCDQAGGSPGPARCALQLDTGMSRHGLSHDEARSLAADPSFRTCVDVVVVMSHLACADTPTSEANLLQRRRFEDGCGLFPRARRSLAASAGIRLGPDYHFDQVRPGVALYGDFGFSEGPVVLEPAIRLEAPVLQIRDIAAGVGVGYDLTWRAAGPRRLATIGLGYADGWPRSLSNRGAGYVRGVPLPVVGRVSMDSVTLDITGLPEGVLRPGDTVEMMGRERSHAQVARGAGTVPHEILARLGPRLERRYLGGR